MYRNPDFKGHQQALSLADRRSYLRVSDCKYCGEAIAWVKSAQGKFYPCEVDTKVGDEGHSNADVLRAAPWRPHKCTARKNNDQVH